MNKAHLHLLLNHLPIILPLVAVVLLGIGIVRKLRVLGQAACIVFIVSAIFAFASMQTGEGAEDAIKNLPGVSRKLIHQHEERAGTFTLISYGLGILSIILLWSYSRRPQLVNGIGVFLLISAIAVLVTGYLTGMSGGLIRHPEIEQNSAVPDSLR